MRIFRGEIVVKLQKGISIVSGVFSILSIILSWLLNKYGCVFASNVFIGLFSSGILVCGVAVIAFLSEYKNRLYQLYCDCMDFSQTAPFGYSISSDKELSTIKSKINQAFSLYNKGIQIHINELSSVPKYTKIYKIISSIDHSTRILENAMIEFNEKLTICVLQECEFEEFLNNEMKINNIETTKAAEEFANAINDLVKYLKHRNIHKWEDCDNAN